MESKFQDGETLMLAVKPTPQLVAVNVGDKFQRWQGDQKPEDGESFIVTRKETKQDRIILFFKSSVPHGPSPYIGRDFELDGVRGVISEYEPKGDNGWSKPPQE